MVEEIAVPVDRLDAGVVEVCYGERGASGIPAFVSTCARGDGRTREVATTTGACSGTYRPSRLDGAGDRVASLGKLGLGDRKRLQL